MTKLRCFRHWVFRHSSLQTARFPVISAQIAPQGLVRSRGFMAYFTVLNGSVRKSLPANNLGSFHLTQQLFAPHYE